MTVHRVYLNPGNTACPVKTVQKVGYQKTATSTTEPSAAKLNENKEKTATDQGTKTTAGCGL